MDLQNQMEHLALQSECVQRSPHMQSRSENIPRQHQRAEILPDEHYHGHAQARFVQYPVEVGIPVTLSNRSSRQSANRGQWVSTWTMVSTAKA